MIVQDVIGRADLTAWRSLEASGEDLASEKPPLHIGVRHWLEPHDGILVMAHILVEDLGVSGRQVFPVHDARDEEGWIPDVVGRVRLVEGVKAYDVGILGEARGSCVPEGHEFVVHVLVIVEQGTKCCDALLGVVVCGEHLFEAIFDEEIAIFVDPVTEVVHVAAGSHQLIEILQQMVDDRIDARGVLADDLLRVKVGHPLAASRAGEDVLVSINERVDASCAELVDESLYLVEVGLVVDSSLALNTFPHDAETNEVHAPLLEVGNVFIVERVLRIELLRARNVGVHFVNDIDTVEDSCAASLVDKESGLRIDLEWVSSCTVIRETGAVFFSLRETRSDPWFICH